MGKPENLHGSVGRLWLRIIGATYWSQMIKLRLKRYGKKRQASYRIVAMNSRCRRDGQPLQELGFYDPRTDETRLDVPGIVNRLKQGAQPTDTVRRILEKANVFEQVSAGSSSQSENSNATDGAEGNA